MAVVNTVVTLRDVRATWALLDPHPVALIASVAGAAPALLVFVGWCEIGAGGMDLPTPGSGFRV